MKGGDMPKDNQKYLHEDFGHNYLPKLFASSGMDNK